MVRRIATIRAHMRAVALPGEAQRYETEGSARSAMSEFTQKLGAWAKTQRPDKRRTGLGKVEVVAVEKDVIEARQAGYSLRTIWAFLREEGRLTISYAAFCRQVAARSSGDTEARPAKTEPGERTRLAVQKLALSAPPTPAQGRRQLSAGEPDRERHADGEAQSQARTMESSLRQSNPLSNWSGKVTDQDEFHLVGAKIFNRRKVKQFGADEWERMKREDPEWQWVAEATRQEEDEERTRTK